jgi:uncharacterized protein (DUF433 family)
MSFAVKAEAPPIREDADGALRVGQSRVLVELVIRAFQAGATPESIAQRFPTAALKDIYSVIAYYLQHQAELDDYLAHREQLADEVQRRIQSQQGDLSEIRARLAARRSA